MNRVARDRLLAVPRGNVGKAKFYEHKIRFTRLEMNALANFCFLTKDTDINIGDRFPEEYFPEVEKAPAEALASQWIPTDSALWKIEHYRDFLEARKELPSAEADQRMQDPLHGEARWLEGAAVTVTAPVTVPGGITSARDSTTHRPTGPGTRRLR